MTLRVGILSTAAINEDALLRPAAATPDVAVTALAARDPDLARAYAARHRIGRVLPDYQSLLDDDQIDAVYIPLPIGLHGQWTIKALRAGKHVLCEKALTANAAEAELVRQAQQQTGLVMLHAFHNRYHALLHRVQQIIESGELGEIVRIEADFDVPAMPAGDIRWSYALGGGVTPDIGIYPIDLVRVLAMSCQPEPSRPIVTSARALTSPADPRVDAVLEAELVLGAGLTGRIRGSMGQGGPARQTALVTGARGTLKIDHFIHPQAGNELVIAVAGHERVEHVAAQPSSYAAQLAAFVGAVRDAAPFPTDATDAIATMAIVDACYAGAGLPLREPTPQ